MWSICGNSFSWTESAESLSINLTPKWHQIVPDLSGPSPDFELEDVKSINEKPLSLRMIAGDYTTLCKHLRAQYQYENITFAPPVRKDVDASVCFVEDRIELTWFRENRELRKCLKHLKDIAKFNNDSYFFCRFQTRFIVGEFAMGTASTMKSHFLNGRLSAAIESNRAVSFSVGRSPEKPSEDILFRELQR